MRLINPTLLLLSLLFVQQAAPAQQSDSIVFKTGYAKINGVNLFYKEAGKGTPILFLHGGLGTSEEHFANQLELFAQNHRVITIHTRGHGKSEIGDAKLSYQQFSDDVFSFMKAKSIDSTSIIGFSDGGIIGAILAAQHPEKVKKLVMIGANSNTDALTSETIAWLKGWDLTKMTRYVKSVFKEHPNPEKLEDYVKTMQELFLNEPNLKDDDLKKIGCPTLIMAGDHDMIKTEHQVYLYRSIPNSTLAILPNASHDAHIEQPAIANEMIRVFLEKR